MQNTQKIRWQRVLLLTAIGFIIAMALGTAYHQWRKRDGWCIRFYPNGKQQILYGGDCWKL